jgi:hypothetical protein
MVDSYHPSVYPTLSSNEQINSFPMSFLRRGVCMCVQAEHRLILSLRQFSIYSTFFFFFEAGSHYVVRAGLELQSSYFFIPRARITDVYHHAWFCSTFLMTEILKRPLTMDFSKGS